MTLKKVQQERIILGIDPGTNVMGYGILHAVGKSTTVVALGVLKLEKYEDYALKLKKIYERTVGLIEEYHPDEMSIEAPFFGKNVQSMLKLGRAQGVAIAAAMSREVSVVEYAPKKIKQVITGNGNASKEQVALMLQKELKFESSEKYLDATDGVAAAYCHLVETRGIQKGKENGKEKGKGKPVSKSSSKKATWESFVAKNPDKILKK